MDINFNNLIKHIRSEMLLSQQDLSILLGVSFATINRWENGHFSPSIKAKREILKLCKKHKIDINNFDNVLR